MNFTVFLDDEDAVSPVIGVILMVAITVILAAVIGTFVLGLGDQVQTTAPNANFDWDQPTNDQLEVTHEGGASIDPAQLKIVPTTSGTAEDCSDPGDWSGGSEVTAGSTCDVESGNPVQGTYRLTWSAEDSDQSSTLTTYEA